MSALRRAPRSYLGRKGEPHGFKWSGRDPDSVRHLCPHCGVLISQAEYLAVEASGVFINEDGTLWIDHETAAFTRPDGSPAPTRATLECTSGRLIARS